MSFNHFSYSSHKNLDKVMTVDQFECVVEAILAGRYSWACVLILRFGGYNPLHYIPYRTYNRLVKENELGIQASGHRLNHSDREEEEVSEKSAPTYKNRLKDLTYLEVVRDRGNKVEGKGSYFDVHSTLDFYDFFSRKF
jgi:hypothetical protein